MAGMFEIGVHVRIAGSPRDRLQWNGRRADEVWEPNAGMD